MPHSRNYTALFWFALLLGFLWLLSPAIERILISFNAEPRAVTARGDLAADEQSTIEVFAQASPSVVFITTSERVIDYWSRNILDVPRGSGSGFIWDDHGHIVTNHHVIAEATSASVRLNDGRSFDAVVVGASPDHDLAVLRIGIGVTSPPPVPIGSSHDLRVGQKTYAIGNPFGLDYTLTSGLVSALNRSLNAENGALIEGLIQTDAAINPGNSGGPLLDSAGRLIGINTAIYSPSGAYAGIGFAVPVDTVNKVVPQLIARGKYLRPSLGIRIDEELNRIAAKRLGYEGVLILDVEPGSAADKAQLRGSKLSRSGALIAGDIIVSVADIKTDSVEALLAVLSGLDIGSQVDVGILREEQQITVKVTLQPGT